MRIRKEVQIGILTITAIVMLAVLVSYLKGRSILATTVTIQASFRDVGGLTKGNMVKYKGMKVGQVQQIVYNPQTQRVDVKFAIEEALKLPQNSKALIRSNLLGAVWIDLMIGDSPEAVREGDVLSDSLDAGMMATVMNELMPVKDQLSTVLVNLEGVTASLNTGLGDTNRMHSILDNVQTGTGNLAKATKNADQLMNDLRQTLAQANEVMQAVKNQEPALNKALTGAGQLTDSLQLTITTLRNSLQATLSALDQTLAQINSGQGTVGKALHSDELHNEVAQSLRDLDALLVDMKARPWRYISFSVFGKKKE
jgi:phospholipid/cholesterol/gamma-HCH transport system substrate-binding protein